MGGSSKWEVVLEMNALAGAQGDVLCKFEQWLSLSKQVTTIPSAMLLVSGCASEVIGHQSPCFQGNVIISNKVYV